MGLCCYTELPLPPFLLHIILFLSYTHRALTWALRAVGLALLIDDDTDFYTPARPPHYHQTPLPSGRPAVPISLSVIRQALPSSRYEPKDEREESKLPDSCSVCLFELEVGDEVRRLGGCRRVFHAYCIDRWVGIGRRTCPLCRAQLIQQELLQKVMIAAGTLSMDSASTDSFDLELTPSETDYYDDGLYYGDDGDYYSLL